MSSVSALNAKLSNDQLMPYLGLGTWKAAPGEVSAAIKVGLKAGYRHLDCAHIYNNEKEIGQALKECFDEGILKRNELFVTSKLWNTKHHPDDVEPACKQTLADLQLEYLDLYLIHWPTAFKRGNDQFPKDEKGNLIYDPIDPVDTWRAMEKLVEKGLVKAIGLSNFNSQQIDAILKVATIKPAVLQVECHPYFNQSKLLDFCKQRNIIVTAYSPLGSPTRPWAKPGEPLLLEEPKIVEIAKKYNKTPAQILIRFQIDRGVVVIPKSVNPERIKSNFQVFDFKLSNDDLQALETFNKGERLCIPTIEVEGKTVPRDKNHPHFPFGIEF